MRTGTASGYQTLGVEVEEGAVGAASTIGSTTRNVLILTMGALRPERIKSRIVHRPVERAVTELPTCKHLPRTSQILRPFTFVETNESSGDV